MSASLLEGKVAIITGAGRGIGAATAKLLSEYGAKVVLGELDPEPGQAVVNEISKAGGQALLVPGDVTKPDYAEQIVKTTLQEFGSLDILVNNAGYTWDGVLHKMTDEQWLAMLEVHLTAPFRLLRAAAGYLRETAKYEIETLGQAQARKIVNVSSTTGTRGNAGQVNYSAGKAGIMGVTKTLAKEWGSLNIQVNACAFGFIQTRLTDAKEAGAKTARNGQDIALGIPEQTRDIAQKLIPMGRAGTAQEAAGAILFFASPLSNYVSGQVLEVTGGS
jgi:3-oxoacyl-[acyl-carrier protein] reductase